MTVLRWSARAAALLLLVVVGAWLAGHPEHLHHPDPAEATLAACFLVTVAGWLVGWAHERIGGWTTVLGFAGLQLVEWSVRGAPALAPPVLILVVPGLLYLASAQRARVDRARNAAVDSARGDAAVRRDHDIEP